MDRLLDHPEQLVWLLFCGGLGTAMVLWLILLVVRSHVESLDQRKHKLLSRVDEEDAPSP